MRALTITCAYCQAEFTFRLEEDSYQRWMGGEHIQDVWPEMTRDERELLISWRGSLPGSPLAAIASISCGPCFDRQWGDE